MKVGGPDAPSGQFVARAPLHIASGGANWVFPVNACASDSPAASVFTVPAETLCSLPSMARTSPAMPFPSSFRFHYITTARRCLPRQRPLLIPQLSLTKERVEPSVLLSLSTNTPSCAKCIEVLRRPLPCLIHESPGLTVDKIRLCARLRLCCLHLLNRPCRPFPRRGSLRLGLAVAETPLLVSLRPPRIKVSIDRILLHLPSHDQPPLRENRARLGASRFLRLRPCPPSNQFLLRRSNTTPTRPHLLRLYIIPSQQRHLGV